MTANLGSRDVPHIPNGAKRGAKKFLTVFDWFKLAHKKAANL
tara:strand:- start:308 stop:433 length:126 start_codon:yes stop_codon:yes gene_type:complete